MASEEKKKQAYTPPEIEVVEINVAELLQASIGGGNSGGESWDEGGAKGRPTFTDDEEEDDYGGGDDGGNGGGSYWD